MAADKIRELLDVPERADNCIIVTMEFLRQIGGMPNLLRWFEQIKVNVVSESDCVALVNPDFLETLVDPQHD
jgi:hypothetical protein